MPWKPLPDTLSPECLRFVTRLRELKDRADVSLTVLAQRTAYSKSSWDRCLNGRALPPRQAVEALCRLVGQPPGQLLALWELAELTWSGRASLNRAPTGGAPASEPPARAPKPAERPPLRTSPAPCPAAPAAGRATRRLYSSWTVALTAVLVAAVTLPLSWWLTGSAGGRTAPGSTVAVSSAQTLCTGRACHGEDPVAVWCVNGSKVVAGKRTDSGVRFEIRHRPACRAVWGRMWFSRPGDRLVVTLGEERFDVADDDPAKTGGYHTTPMLTTDTPWRVSACYLPQQGRRVCIGG
ncbi:hypothetical protein SUDANB6_05688 [Streptomyces sp. enrichment culture]|uniref:helix-turn-helix domain-containing protein n=1 Tax=Streptomyces sp. enrichment culture TaxID=1795815 RepID=UPI003F554D26